eukprot:TRINITY_DN15164_c0_g1_i1.p1 TRINITY_DN15164_c0_g1~~TRINITY_DN15164_c0_g1_i1.p1  ORF type:complete len:464 (+),score=105.98 TRINITY_DN15164_c0_g1_i1:35-1426(+)
MWRWCFFVLLFAPWIDCWPNRTIYYSPSIIGQDSQVRKIDIYTDFFSLIHRRDLELIKELGATCIMVSENWAADGSTVHHYFMDMLLEFGISLIVTFAPPVNANAAFDDKAKSAFALLISEFFPDTRYYNLLIGFHIPSPPMEKMSSIDQLVYFQLVNQFSSIIEQKVTVPRKPLLFTGFPINPVDRSVPIIANFDFTQVLTDYWVVDLYDSGYMDSYIGYWGSKSMAVAPVLAMIKAQSFDNNKKESNQTIQAIMLETIFENYTQEITDFHMLTGIFEFSDEWWRSDLATAGYDTEGCPNSNPYAHTSCGITTSQGIMNLEYLGLFQIRDIPLGYCVIPKEAAVRLCNLWNGNGKCSLTAGIPTCTGLTSVVPWYVFPILAGLSMVVFVLLLVLPTPNPPKITDKQLKYFVDDDLDRDINKDIQDESGLLPDPITVGIDKSRVPADYDPVGSPTATSVPYHI